MGTSWWVNDVGAAAGATYDPITRQPMYGAALDLGTTRTIPWGQRETMHNAVRTQVDDNAAAQGWAQQKVSPFLRNAGAAVSSAWDRVDQTPVGKAAAAGGKATAWAFDKSGADSALDSVVDAILLAGRAVATYQAQQNMAVADGQYTEVNWITGPQKSPTIASMFDGDLWERAWDSTDPEKVAEPTSIGRATVDMAILSLGLGSEHTEDLVSRGMVNPDDDAFNEYRQTSTPYNVVSGAADFAYSWWLAPEALALKAAGKGTTLVRGRTTLLPEMQRARFRDLALAADDELVTLNPRRTSLLDKSALRARSRIADLRAKITTGQVTFEDLSNMSFARHAAQGDTGAAAYVLERAAHADDETWRLAVKGAMGDYSAKAELGMHADMEISDAIAAIHADRLRASDLISTSHRSANAYDMLAAKARKAGDEVAAARWSERSMLKQQEAANASADLTQLVRNEREQESLRRMMLKVAGEVWDEGAPAGREGLLIDAPIAGGRARELVRRTYVWSPTRYGKQVRISSTASMLWKRQPGVVDLHRGDGALENAKSYLDMAERYANPLATKGHRSLGLDETWVTRREDALRRLAGAQTDVERRSAMMQVQDLGISVVARSHGMDFEDANVLRTWLTKKQSEALGQLNDPETSRVWTRAEMVDDNGKAQRLDLIDNGDGELVATPVSVTQLQNWYTAVDLRQLDKMLKIHGDDVKTRIADARKQLSAVGEGVESALDWYNHIWKFSVLFRLGYPARTIMDDSMRSIAAAGGLQYVLEQIHAPQLAQRAKRRAGKTGEPGVEAGTRAARTRDGARVTVPEALSGPEGFAHRRLASSDAAWGQFFDVYLDANHRARKAMVTKSDPGAWDYTKHWADLAHQQILLDPVQRRMLDGWTDADLAQWLRTSAEGKDVLARLPGYVDDGVTAGDTVEMVLYRLREHLEYMAPEGPVRDILRQALHGDLIKQGNPSKSLRKALDDALEADPDLLSRMGTVDFATSGMNTGLGPVAGAYTAITSRIFKYLQQLPNDTLARNPMFRASYGRRIQEILGQYHSGQITEQVIKAAARDANEYALTRLRRYLFSLNEETEFLHLLRHIMPFGTATMESLRKWGQVFLDNPVGVYRVWGQGWAGLGDLHFIEEVDREGNAVPPDERWTTDSWLRFRVPDSLISVLPALKGLYSERDGGVYGQISKGSTNLIVQGDPFFVPSVGPIVQIPADFFFKRHPELTIEGAPTKEFYDYLFPTGAPMNLIDTLLPTSMSKAISTARTDPAFNATEALVMKQTVANFRQEHGRDPNRGEMQEIARRAEQQSAWIRRYYFLGSVILPSNVYYIPGDQELIEQYRRLVRELGQQEGYATFVSEYGWEAAVLGQSMSMSTNGVPATGIGILDYQKWQRYIQDYPELGDIIVSPLAWKDDFEAGVYRFQQQQPTGPGRPERQRGSKGSLEVLEDAGVQQGWSEYGEVQRYVRAELTARFGEGATLNRKGAEDLAEIQRAAREDIAQRYPAWSLAYGERDTRWGLDYLDAARHMLADVEVKDPNYGTYAPQLAGLRDYIQVHDYIAGQLAARREAGGSASIDAESNADLLAVWDQSVALITHQNPAFAEQVYDRKLENWKPVTLTP